MAQSIFVTLDTLETETSVPVVGSNVKHSLPRSMFPTSEQFSDEKKLLAWAEETGCLHACLQKGVSAKLIDARATFKAVKKNETWSAEYGQKNVDAMKWEPAERPAGAKTDEQKAIEAMSKLDPAKLAELLAMIQANK